MKLYNTLTRKVEEIKPLKAGQVGVYTCGPTVYDYPHIGNWFTFIRYDLLVRTLRAQGLRVKWVMNITDVGHLVSDADEGEDKLEKGAKREGKSAWEIAKYYTDYFEKGLRRLNFTAIDHMPKATEHIAEQISLVQTLEKKGYTYAIGDGIYYDTAKFPHYADFARLDLDEQQAGARVAANPEKHNPSDFALWKFSPPGGKRDMEWDSPWGTGFPGWHLECSAMALKYLGVTVDIHSGGIDHIPVHHSNEIAQSQAATGRPLANIWMHTNHILVDDQKIAKSAGNGITLEDIEAHGYTLAALRLLVLESHYRSQSRFSWETMEAASNRMRELRAMAVLRYQPRAHANDGTGFAFADVPGELAGILADDLNTPAALAFLSNVSNQINAVLLWHKSLSHFEAMLRSLDDLLGLGLSDVPNLSDAQKKLLQARETARAAQDWPRADSLRDELRAHGVGLRDTDQGVIWFYL